MPRDPALAAVTQALGTSGTSRSLIGSHPGAVRGRPSSRRGNQLPGPCVSVTASERQAVGVSGCDQGAWIAAVSSRGTPRGPRARQVSRSVTALVTSTDGAARGRPSATPSGSSARPGAGRWRRPPPGVPRLELRDLPVGTLDHLPAAVAGAVAAQEPVGIGDAHRVVGDQLGPGRDVGHRRERELVDPAEVGVAGVVGEVPCPRRSTRVAARPTRAQPHHDGARRQVLAANQPRPAISEARTSSGGVPPGLGRRLRHRPRYSRSASSSRSTSPSSLYGARPIRRPPSSPRPSRARGLVGVERAGRGVDAVRRRGARRTSCGSRPANVASSVGVRRPAREWSVTPGSSASGLLDPRAQPVLVRLEGGVRRDEPLAARALARDEVGQEVDGRGGAGEQLVGRGAELEALGDPVARPAAACRAAAASRTSGRAGQDAAVRARGTCTASRRTCRPRARPRRRRRGRCSGPRRRAAGHRRRGPRPRSRGCRAGCRSGWTRR